MKATPMNALSTSFRCARIWGLAALLATPVLAAAAPAVTNPPPVFIAAFSDETGGRAGEGVAAAVRDLLLASLSDRRAVQLVDRDDLERVLTELQLTLAGLTDPARGVQVGRLLGAERLVTGSLLPDEKGVLAVAHILDVRTAVVQASCKVAGPTSELPELTTRLAHDLAEALHLPFDPGPATRLERAPLASLHTLRGLGSFHAGNYDLAIMEFAISDELKADNPALHYWSGRAYSELDEPEHAAIEFRRYLDRDPQGPEATDARERLARCDARVQERPPDGAAPVDPTAAGRSAP